MPINTDVVDAIAQPTNEIVLAHLPDARVERQHNVLLNQVVPFPTERKARFKALFSNGQIGMNSGLEDVRTVKTNGEFFSPDGSALSAGGAIIGAVCDGYGRKDLADPAVSGLLARQALALRSPGFDGFPKADMAGQCIVIAGPPGIGKGAFRRRIRSYLGDEPVPHWNPSPTIHFMAQLKYVEMPFPTDMKVESLVNLLLMQMSAQTNAVTFKDSQRMKVASLARPRLYTLAGMIGLGLLYVYGLDGDKLSRRRATECLEFLREFAEYTGVPVVCSSTYSIFGALDGSSAGVLKLADGPIRRLDYLRFDSQWCALVSAFLQRHSLTVAVGKTDFSPKKSIPKSLMPTNKSILETMSWFEGMLMSEALGLPKLLFAFLTLLWQVLCKKAKNRSVVELADFAAASAQYRKTYGLLRSNLSILLNKDRCSDEELAKFSNWIPPEQRGF